jgi:hypothetical protein
MANQDRDPVTPYDDIWVKKAALACAEANACGTEQELERCEEMLRVGLLCRGIVSLDEYDKLSHFDYDGLPDEQTGVFYHRVYFYVQGNPTPALDITCNA